MALLYCSYTCTEVKYDYLCITHYQADMDTKAIFDYLYEVETRRSFQKQTTTNLSGKEEYSWYDYVHLIRRMSRRFEACVFQCVAENPDFKSELHVIANKLNSIKAYYEQKKREIPEAIDVSFRQASSSVERELKYLQDNYGVKVESAIEQEPNSRKQKEKKEVVEAKSFMNLQEVTAYFGLPMNNIKDKQWRDKHSFPYMQPSGGRGKVIYIKEDVEEWMRNNKQ